MNITSPVILLNYKTYSQATGKNAVKLTEIVEKLSKKHGVSIVIAPQFVDIAELSKKFKVLVFSQHIDPIEPGKNTGHILPESIKAAGGIGTLINHSERQVPLDILEKTIEKAKKLQLITCVCAENLEMSGKTAKLGPDYVAFELPELIGSGKSISTTEPELVKAVVKHIRDANANVIPLCGAGISTGEDVYAALKLGTEGVLVASAFTKAEDPRAVLEDFLMAVKKYLAEK